MRESGCLVGRAGSQRPAGGPGRSELPRPGCSVRQGRSGQGPGQGDELRDPYAVPSVATLLGATGRVKGRPTGLRFQCFL